MERFGFSAMETGNSETSRRGNKNEWWIHFARHRRNVDRAANVDFAPLLCVHVTERQLWAGFEPNRKMYLGH